MTDYSEEQNNEIEALQSIYPDELEIINDSPKELSVTVTSESFEEDTEKGARCCLHFTYTPTYPDVAPIVTIDDAENLLDSETDELMAMLQQLTEENLGMAMVFTLVSSTQEWLNNKCEENDKRKEEEAERRIQEAEEAERVRFEGIRVTVESFLAWRAGFEAEMSVFKVVRKDEVLKSRKLTGKELFLKDQSLIESDLRFFEEGGEEVKVDESLFQDLDDLDIDDGIEEDED